MRGWAYALGERFGGVKGEGEEAGFWKRVKRKCEGLNIILRVSYWTGLGPTKRTRPRHIQTKKGAYSNNIKVLKH